MSVVLVEKIAQCKTQDQVKSNNQVNLFHKFYVIINEKKTLLKVYDQKLMHEQNMITALKITQQNKNIK